MKTTLTGTLFFLATIFSFSAIAQDAAKSESSSKAGLGIKFGANFANVTNASNINAANRTGFQAGAFISPGFSGKTIMGYRSEILFSRQGYDFKTNTKSGSVMLDYILLPQMTTVNITRFVQLQAGIQLAYLLNAKADSSSANGSKNPYAAVADYYNRFEYGFAGGVEIHPVKGLLLGARYNLGLSNVYKETSTTMPIYPAFIPPTKDLKSKNNVVQVFVGYKF
ncbi:MAG: PorT family protein [Williamsia sp.]|nr:PorT family protein [Williamsia sp.]